MKKLLTLFMFFLVFFVIIGCKTEDEDFSLPDPIRKEIQQECGGQPNYFMIDGECVLITQHISKNITINENITRVENINSIELMDEFIADLSGSKGLAVVSRDVYDNSINMGGSSGYEIMSLATLDTYGDTQNIIVKLTEEGFFEEVGFTDQSGQSVDITSNPLALEVYGAYTVVIFEVDFNNNMPNNDFQQKVFNSFAAGGIYLIHNETGKLFATKSVEQIESTHTYYENHSRNVRLMVRVNEPVIETQTIPLYDEFNMPVHDEFGNVIYVEVLVPVVDSNGNPVIFTEAPILTEEKMVGLVKYFEQQVVDENGNPQYDANNEPIFEIVEEPILDEFGKQIFQLQIVPVLDNLGQVQYQEEFEVELFIEDNRTITVIQYSAIVLDNPITKITQRFVEKIMSEYYNWNYYRVNNYMISSYGFSVSNEDIYYMETVEENGSGIIENFVMKLSFDHETNELTITRYLNATKANFTNCDIILDPRNNNIICRPYDNNIKVYSQTEGLVTIPNSKNFQPVTFPNGELYFYSHNQTYVEELGYYTTLLYVINSDGTMISHYIELGEKDEISFHEWDNTISVDLYDNGTEPYETNRYINIETTVGEKIIANADLTVQNIGTFSSLRQACTDSNGCWYSMQTDILDANGSNLVTLDFSSVYYPGDPVPNYKETYQINANTTYQYELKYSNIDAICDNVNGCVSQISLIDKSINEYGVWMSKNEIVPNGEQFLNSITINELNSAIYEYSKVVSGVVCNYATCDENIKIKVYDDSGKLISESHNQVQIAQGEKIPLYIEYRISTNTTIVMESMVCTTSTGCFRSYETFDQKYYWINYKQGDSMYQSITFVDTDKQIITEETLNSQFCMDIMGCYDNEETIYSVVDEFGTEIHRFSQYIYLQYGYRKPYKVTVSIADTTLEYRKESLLENKVCESATCRVWVEFTTSEDLFSTLGWGYVAFQNGEEIYNRVVLSGATPISYEDEMRCKTDDGCIIYTNQFKLFDQEGKEYKLPSENWIMNSLPVRFAKGEKIPVDSNFEVTFVLTNVQYRKLRINVHDFIYSLNNVIRLDDNVYLIEKQTWVQGNDNYILIFDEVESKYFVKYTNISAFTEITKFKEGYIAINSDKTAIINFTYNTEQSTQDYYYFNVVNLTTGLKINGVNELVIDYDGSIYFKGVDNFIQDITGSITEDGTVTIDTEYVQYEVIRLRPIN